MAYDLLSYVPFLQRSIDIPYYHHERWDGSGYPHAIKGNEIPLAARMFAYIDVWDALVSNRPYRRAMEKSEIRAYFEREAGRLFDPDLLEIFLNLECLDWSSVFNSN
jgi:response regulator RpfG family c-di-GMP phosphodiesterase